MQQQKLAHSSVRTTVHTGLCLSQPVQDGMAQKKETTEKPGGIPGGSLVSWCFDFEPRQPRTLISGWSEEGVS